MKISWRGKLLIGVVAAYFAFLWPAALRIVPENDLWWIFPTMKSCLQGKSPWQIFIFLFNALPLGFSQQTLKIYFYAVSQLIGPEIRWLILTSMVFQVGNAVLLGLLARQWGLGARVSAVAAVIFLVFFGHFHAVLWPTAFQHLVALTNILVLLILYFWTEERLRSGKRGTLGFIGVALATLAASAQRSVLIAVVIIAADLFAFSRGPSERARRFRRWWWVFLLYAIYPILMLTFVGEPTLTEGLRKLSIPDWLRMLLVTDPLFPNPLHWGVRSAVLIGLMLVVLWAGMAALHFAPGRWLERAGWRLYAAAGAVILLLWCLKDHRQLLFPYNGFVPFLASFSILLDPLRTALSMDSVQAFYYLTPQVSTGSVLLALAAIAVFCKTHVLPNRKLTLLVAWYLVTLVATIHQNSSLPMRTPSRYFIYLSPVVAIVAACVLESLSTWVFRGKRSGIAREIALYGIVAALCVSNLSAVPVALFRGRLTNALFFYDDLRTVRLIRNEVHETGEVRVSGVAPMPIGDVWRDFPLAIPPDYDNLAIAAEVLGGGPMRAEKGDGGATGDKAPLYLLEGIHLLRPGTQVSMEPFYQLIMGAKTRLSRENLAWGRDGILEGVTRPPFLIAYLTEGVRVSDLRWITGGLGLTDWLSRIFETQRDPGHPESAKLTRVRKVMEEEARWYLQAIVSLAYAEQKLGNSAECRYWLSQAQLIESDPEAIVHAMNMFFGGSVEKDILDFLDKIKDPTFLLEPFNQKKEDYAVGRFLLRLLMGLDIRSSWDRRFSKTL